MTRAIRQLLAPTLLLVALMLVQAQAASASAIDVLRDCADSDSLDRPHSKADLRAARGQIPGDLAEYGNCDTLIDAALAATAKKAKASNAGGGGDDDGAADVNGDGVVSPAERRAAVAKKAHAKKREREQLASVGPSLSQDDGDDGPAGDVSDDGVPLPAILALIALLCGGVGGGVWYAAKRNPGFADALRRVAPPFRRG